jgi:AraC-like DNA-binding protein
LTSDRFCSDVTKEFQFVELGEGSSWGWIRIELGTYSRKVEVRRATTWEPTAPRRKGLFADFLKDRDYIKRIDNVSAHFLGTDELRVVIRRRGFRVRALAAYFGLGARTLERRFGEQFRMTPKAWITRERMSLAPPLLAEGLSNKQVAEKLSYTCESNFCRDFKRHFGCAPQEFTRIDRGDSDGVAF